MQHRVAFGTKHTRAHTHAHGEPQLCGQSRRDPGLPFFTAPQQTEYCEACVGWLQRSDGPVPERRPGDALFGGATMTCTHKQKQQGPQGRLSSNRLQSRWEEAAASSQGRRPNIYLFMLSHEPHKRANVSFNVCSVNKKIHEMIFFFVFLVNCCYALLFSFHKLTTVTALIGFLAAPLTFQKNVFVLIFSVIVSKGIMSSLFI